ncbi:Di-copper centre-containing [Venustampulla echinocandica]|uniref:Di-copper centre-containing n=1 Tax=Venustampulla echinocandica TaxID=2656787 RepID=A0A370TYF6_9HELO|nr:Di-copper centre-containing [Venustampulla echinocandica]RDL40550.1 Di-copper centre-containing [Venustampulla echinocandica]
MRLQHVPAWASLLALTSATYQPASTFGTDLLAAKGLINLAVHGIEQAAQGKQGSCTLANVAIRKEWGMLSNTERKSYTDAVLCLMSKPSKTNPSEAPGAKTRYDDFTWTHIKQTLSIHGTANFLSWHRWYTYIFEKALREECGYQGYQPYCKCFGRNWGRWANDPVNSPIFDGGPYSMSGNGDYVAHGCTYAIPTNLNCIPPVPGQGGGCVTTGPFKNITVNLGPVVVSLNGIPELVPNNGSVWNPRCMRRDISSWVATRWTSDAVSTALINDYSDIYWFQKYMQGDFVNGDYGVHTAGHFTVGGDPGGDIFASPGDPMFWLHHAQVDRTWWIWQNQDIKNRQNAISGTITLDNIPPSRNGTLDDLLDVGVNASPVPISSMMSTTAGPLCYIYL